MKSEWKVSSNVIGDQKWYQVYRIKDTSQVHHSGNREEFGGLHSDKYAAQKLADELNMQEESK